VSDAGSQRSIYRYREMGFQATDFKILDARYDGLATWRTLKYLAATGETVLATMKNVPSRPQANGRHGGYR